MTVLECAMKTNGFKNIDEAIYVIESGGFRMNHTVIKNPSEVLIYGQHILMNNLSVIRIGKKNYIVIKWLA